MNGGKNAQYDAKKQKRAGYPSHPSFAQIATGTQTHTQHIYRYIYGWCIFKCEYGAHLMIFKKWQRAHQCNANKNQLNERERDRTEWITKKNKKC